MKLQYKHDPSALSYRLVTYQEWLDNYGGADGEFKTSIMNDDKSEVMLTYRDEPLGDLTRKQAQDYILANLPSEVTE